MAKKNKEKEKKKEEKKKIADAHEIYKILEIGSWTISSVYQPALRGTFKK